MDKSTVQTASTTSPTADVSATNDISAPEGSDAAFQKPKLRTPRHYGKPAPEGFALPPPSWLCGTWHVTHSTLPLWKDKRNVKIKYEQLLEDKAKLDDLVLYQTLTSPKIKTVHGIDTPAPEGQGVYNWRGKGWLMIASSKWEVLGWGKGIDGEEWVITYFSKTLFTPAGIDIYSRHKDGVTKKTLDALKDSLRNVDGHGDETMFAKLVGKIFEIKRDDSAEIA